ncbi:hypothetical protein O6027_12000 [Sphingomonas aerolata]|jgi:hypothetical protein|uniref:hypothetical protein n=1 Tax=Sphingomonas aerolata TaxID=185951 RepID=UPI003344B119
MARKRKKEAISVTFHYLDRQTTNEDDELVISGFTADEYNALVEKLKSLPKLDIHSEEFMKLIRSTNRVPIEDVETLNDDICFGLYKGVYTGHSYDNTEKGKISADSMNLRPFYFLMYLSSTGRIYIGTQYLGHYGSYVELRETIKAFLPDKKSIAAHSFRLDSFAMQNLVAKEVRVRISKTKGKASDNVFDEGALVAFRKTNRDDDFEGEVAKRLLPFMGTDKEKVQKAVQVILKESKLVDVNDEDIADCMIIGEVNGQRKTVFMMEPGLFATQFPIVAALNLDGHPVYSETKKAMVSYLTDNIISKKEDA